MSIDANNKYPSEYLKGINEVLTNRMDGNIDGKKDGKVTIDEAQRDLNLPSLLAGLKEGSAEYTKLKGLIDNIPEALKKYAGSDGIFQNEEWANFLGSSEWNQVLDAFHSSSNFSKMEMNWIDSSEGMFKDGKITKGEVKAGLLNNLQKMYLPVDADKDKIADKLEKIVDKFAGEDGTFSVEEYTAMKNNPEYKQITKALHLVPFGENNRDNDDSAVEFARALPQNPNASETTLQVGRGAKKIKGYFAENPKTGEMVYADEFGQRFTKEAFENWEQFAKDGTFKH